MLEVRDLNAFYGQSHILHGINLDLAEGESIALLGRNGAGKSTFLKALLNADPRTEGAMRFGAQTLDTQPTHTRTRLGMSLVPEDRRIFPKLTVAQNIEMGAFAAREEQKPYTIAEVVDLLPMVGPLLNRFGYQLSGGQQQMVAIARGLIARPRLLMLDEPAEGLAPVIVDELSDTINAIRKAEGRSIVVTEQNIDFARQTTDRLYLLDVGSVVFSGTWEEFSRNADLVDRYLVL
ncbi:ABC branched chain amino acid transporter, ATPase subunit [Sulfitobacter noctilucae]|uniref:ABC transporter ATP-binding protein n=1 Tax=Sulfitobacter noctilucae TaxID=1342302 RepID=UPI0004680F78|nr:ABC transporter ATP-binding protein [Sulfitobacter noctilucae]KIN70962.1 ABC branched chain amino acid transporter, ATPase subunit [Sulfitobacter noctilucae]